MTTINLELIQRTLGRELTEPEKEIARACAPLDALAIISIQEGVTLQAANRIAALFKLYITETRRTAGETAAGIVAAERLSPGIISDDDRKTRH